MKLKIFNPEGVHAREIKGLAVLRENLPSDWFGYASFEMIGHDGGEIDLVICTHDRLIVTEIKDWDGVITDNGNTWQTSGRIETSPVISVSLKAKKLKSKLKKFLAPKYDSPWVDHCVLLTGKSRRSDLREESREKTFELEFFKKIGNGDTFKTNFPNRANLNVPMQQLKVELDKFFSADRVRPQSLSYAGYKADNDPCYVHPKKIYAEYFAEKIGAKGFRGLLRRWDFQQMGDLDAAYHNLENRKVLALREENAIGYLRETKPDFSQRNVFLAPIANEGRDSVTEKFFELYDLPTNLTRLKESLQRFGAGLKDDNRVSIARLLLSHFSELHELEVTHRDIGEHCIWVQIPDKVSLSGFATSSFPEQRTVSQIRETIRAGSERIPEDVLECKSDNYRKDVFLLGSVVHQIFFGKRPESPDGFPAWKEPNNGKFKRFWSWFNRSLDIDPDRRFPNAMAAFEEFQRCDSLEKHTSVNESDFSEFTKRFQPQPGENDDIIREDDHAVVFRTPDSEVSYHLVKVWPARFNPGAVSENFQLLEFFKRIKKLQIKDLPSQQKIIDFGHTKYGSYVTLQWEDGNTLNHCEFIGYDDDKAICLIECLVQAVAEMHSSGFYHGDLKPENILLVSNGSEKDEIRLIDCIDYAPYGTQRRTSAYIPPEGETASTPACDGYALRKIVTEFLFTRMNRVSEQLKQKVGWLLESMLNPDGGDPDLEGALRELEKVARGKTAAVDVSAQKTVISMKGIDRGFELLPGDCGLPVVVDQDSKYRNFLTIKITNQAHSIMLQYDIVSERITKIRKIDSSLIEFNRAMKWHVALLKNPIKVKNSNKYALASLESLLKTAGVFEKLRQSGSIKPANQEQSEANTVATLPRPKKEKDVDSIFIDNPVRLEKLWETLIEAESKILPTVTVVDAPTLVEKFGVMVIPIGEASQAFEFQDEEPVQIEMRNRQGEWQYLGNLDNRNSSISSLAVTMQSGWRPYFPPVNCTLRLENVASRASYDKRQTAIQRIVNGHSVCPNLIKFFAGDEELINRMAQFTSRLEGLEQYDLNPAQVDALSTALTSSPLSMIQGPPGTGKTSVISAAVHYIAKNYSSAKILVVSQSHEAIDHATEQIVKRFRKHGEEPSLVRVGRRVAVSDNLISFHSESLQGEYRERFRSSLSARIAPVGARLGLSEEFVSSLTILRLRLVPLLRQIDAESRSHKNLYDEDSTVMRNLKKACRQLDSDFYFDGIDVSLIYEKLEDRLVERCGETDFSAINALRNVIDLALEWVQILERPGKLDNFYVRSCQIVTGTCIGVGRRDLGIESETFDCVIIDEAARCSPGDLAVASQVAEQVILLGDHKQLPPFLEKKIVDAVSDELGCDKKIVEQSDFQRLFRSKYAEKAGRTLKTQYRMREPIGRLVSECFYPELQGIESGRFESAEVYGRMTESFGSHVTWADIGHGGEEKSATSFINRHEIERIMKLLEELGSDEQVIGELIQDADREALPAAIGIIAAYKAQADAIKERIWASSLPECLRATCKVDTVDSYQGKENPIVIFSAVRCNPFEEIGFTKSWERVNVSLSRARERLVIVGSWKFWRQTGEATPLGKVAHYIENRINQKDVGYNILKHEAV